MEQKEFDDAKAAVYKLLADSGLTHLAYSASPIYILMQSAWLNGYNAATKKAIQMLRETPLNGCEA